MMADLRDELKTEYALLQAQYEDFDKRALSLKALATPLLGAGLAAAAEKHLLSVAAATTLIGLCLWALEAIWKTFQYCYVPRIKCIEEWFRADKPSAIAPFQIFDFWGVEYRKRRPIKDIIGIACQPFVALPYLPIIALGIALFVAIGLHWVHTDGIQPR